MRGKRRNSAAARVHLQSTKRELTRRLKQTGVLKFLGSRLMAADWGRVTLRIRVERRMLQAHRVVHGGVMATLADTAGGMATYMAVPVGSRVATVEMKINFLEPVDQGTMTADARVIRLGRNFAVVDCDVKDHAGKLVGKALMTFAHDAAANPRWKR